MSHQARARTALRSARWRHRHLPCLPAAGPPAQLIAARPGWDLRITAGRSWNGDSLEERVRHGELPVDDAALLADLCCGAGEERCQVVAERSDGMDQGGEHAVEPVRGVGVAVTFGPGELPWSDVVDV